MILGADPRVTLVVAFVLLVIGVVLPLLMVLHYIPSTLLLNFLAFGSSFLGILLGIVGAIFLAARGRKRDM